MGRVLVSFISIMSERLMLWCYGSGKEFMVCVRAVGVVFSLLLALGGRPARAFDAFMSRREGLLDYGRVF